MAKVQDDLIARIAAGQCASPKPFREWPLPELRTYNCNQCGV